ncbi:DNA-binding transcription factor [Aureococcus anophagefferens]|nr:DNA-binding transcription factor [Aureococcus anophagefferens]
MAGGKVKFEEPEPEEGGTSTPPDQLGQIPGDGIVLRVAGRRRPVAAAAEAIDEEGSGVSRLGDGSGRAATQGSCISPPPRRRGGPSFNSPFAGLAAAVSFSAVRWRPAASTGASSAGARRRAAPGAPRPRRRRRGPPVAARPAADARVSHLPEVMTPTALDGGAALSPQRLLDFCLSPLNARSPEARGISHGAEGEMADLLPGGLGDGGAPARADDARDRLAAPRRVREPGLRRRRRALRGARLPQAAAADRR